MKLNLIAAMLASTALACASFPTLGQDSPSPAEPYAEGAAAGGVVDPALADFAMQSSRALPVKPSRRRRGCSCAPALPTRKKKGGVNMCVCVSSAAGTASCKLTSTRAKAPA